MTSEALPQINESRSILNRNAVEPSSPGLAASVYPGIMDKRSFQPQRGCVIPLTKQKQPQPRCGWDSPDRVNPG